MTYIVRRTVIMENWVKFLFILIGLLIMAGAIIVFLFRMIKREPFWPSFKNMVKLFFDGFWGIG
jgi:hypothetical protein